MIKVMDYPIPTKAYVCSEFICASIDKLVFYSMTKNEEHTPVEAACIDDRLALDIFRRKEMIDSSLDAMNQSFITT